MRKLYILVFLFIASYANSQLSISPNTLEVSTSENGKYTYYLTVTNTSNSIVNFWWQVVKNNDFPTNWTTTVCDLNLCYAPNVNKCSKNRVNIIGANETKICTLYLEPNGVVGTSGMHLEFYSDKDLTSFITETDPNALIVTGTTSSTSNVNNSDLRVFPNPTDDYFVVRNDNNVAKVGLYNIIGKEVYTLKHTAGTNYDVSTLSKGVYIVRLIDNRGKVMKSIRLSKR